MSYRTYVNDYQIFGNDEYYPEWEEYLKTQNIFPDSDGHYSGEIHDFMGAISALEKVVIRLNKERKEQYSRIMNGEDPTLREYANKNHVHIPTSIYDLEGWFKEAENRTLSNTIFDTLLDLEDTADMMLPLSFFNVCKDDLERIGAEHDGTHWYCYQIKKDHHITVSAS